MSGVPVHMQDPISPAHAPASSSSSTQATTMLAASSHYSPTKPGAAVPKTTQTTASAEDGPPSPQPGAMPVPLAPAPSTQGTLPPPPKAGEKAKPPDFYAPLPITSPTTQPQMPPPRMSYAPPHPATEDVHSSSTTSTTTKPSFLPLTHPTTLPTNVSSRASLEHPPGYVQNPYASDMTPEQRLAVQQEQQYTQSDSLGYTENRSRANSVNARFDDVGEAWKGAKKWVTQKGEEVGERVGGLHGRVWDSVGGRK